MRRAALALACLGTACREETPPPVFELRAVVAPALARLEAELPPVAASDAGDAAAAREAFDAILGPLRSGDPDFVALALEDAARLPPAAVELAAQALLDPSEEPAVRVALADVLGLCATPRALEALLDGLEATDVPALRVQCAYRLGQAGDDRVVPRLILRLKYEQDLQTVYWLVDALARFGHLDGLEPLVVVWSRAEGELRAHAAARLSELAAEHG
ncbi:MAG TPA: HEAT repeat domain-containing protein, partial [Planctomycetota bacterium]